MKVRIAALVLASLPMVCVHAQVTNTVGVRYLGDVIEEGDTINFTLTRTTHSGALTVGYAVTGFAVTTGNLTVVMPPGDGTVTLGIEARDDMLENTDKSVTISIRSISSQYAPSTVNRSATVTVLDNEPRLIFDIRNPVYRESSEPNQIEIYARTGHWNRGRGIAPAYTKRFRLSTVEATGASSAISGEDYMPPLSETLEFCAHGSDQNGTTCAWSLRAEFISTEQGGTYSVEYYEMSMLVDFNVLADNFVERTEHVILQLRWLSGGGDDSLLRCAGMVTDEGGGQVGGSGQAACDWEADLPDHSLYRVVAGRTHVANLEAEPGVNVARWTINPPNTGDKTFFSLTDEGELTFRTAPQADGSDGNSDNIYNPTVRLLSATNAQLLTADIDVEVVPRPQNITIAARNDTVSEGAGLVAFDLTRPAGDTGEDVLIHMEVTQEGNYLRGYPAEPPLRSSVVLSEDDTSVLYSVTLVDDDEKEDSGSVTVRIVETQEYAYISDAPGNEATVAITDDDTPKLELAKSHTASIDEGSPFGTGSAHNRWWTVTLDRSPVTPVSADYAIVPGETNMHNRRSATGGTGSRNSDGLHDVIGTDFISDTGTLTWPANTTELEKMVTPTIIGGSDRSGDGIREGRETIAITLSNARNATVVDPRPQDAQWIVEDLDGQASPSITLDPGTVVTEGDTVSITAMLSPLLQYGAVNFALTLTYTPPATQTFAYFEAPGNATSRILTIPAMSSGSAVLRLVSVDDTAENATRHVGLAVVVSDTDTFTGIGLDAEHRNLAVQFNDDDEPPVLSLPNSLTVSEDAGPLEITVTLASAWRADSTFSYTTADNTAFAGTDYTATSGTGTIDAGETTTKISVPLIDDDEFEFDKEFVVIISDPVNAKLGGESGDDRVAVTLTSEDLEDADRDGVPDETDNCTFDANAGQTDSDGDGLGDACDNCPNYGSGTSQTDTDGDGVGDLCDNCINDANADQADKDDDGIGDACDPMDDTDNDGDGVANVNDNCPNNSNSNQADGDSDGVGNVCDNCPGNSNSGQADSDGDGVGNVCDNCVNNHNPGQADSDGDGIGNVCDPAEQCNIGSTCLSPNYCPSNSNKGSDNVCRCNTDYVPNGSSTGCVVEDIYPNNGCPGRQVMGVDGSTCGASCPVDSTAPIGGPNAGICSCDQGLDTEGNRCIEPICGTDELVTRTIEGDPNSVDLPASRDICAAYGGTNCLDFTVSAHSLDSCSWTFTSDRCQHSIWVVDNLTDNPYSGAAIYCSPTEEPDDPGPATLVMKKGSGPNSWSAALPVGVARIVLGRDIQYWHSGPKPVMLRRVAPMYGLWDTEFVVRKLQVAPESVQILESSGEGWDAIDGIEKLVNLRVVDLSDNRIEDVWPMYWLPALEVVDLSGNPVIVDTTPLERSAEGERKLKVLVVPGG